MGAVARGLRERWPDRLLLIAADNDHRAEKELRPDGKPRENVGLKKAQEAAANHKGVALVPPFADGDKGSDWNDYAQQHGDEAARKELERQVAQARTDAAMNAERMMVIAREREAEARNDPTTSADDALVAQERAAANDLMARAVAGGLKARAEARDALVANATGAPRPVAASRGRCQCHDGPHQSRAGRRIEGAADNGFRRTKRVHETGAAEGLTAAPCSSAGI